MPEDGNLCPSTNASANHSEGLGDNGGVPKQRFKNNAIPSEVRQVFPYDFFKECVSTVCSREVVF